MWWNPQENADRVTFIEEIVNGNVQWVKILAMAYQITMEI